MSGLGDVKGSSSSGVRISKRAPGTEERMMTGTWEPIREAHSIESVAAVVQFPSELNDAMLRKMLRAADANADKMNLPVRETMTGFQLNIGPAGPFAATVPTVDHAPMLGVVFKRNEIESVGGLPTTVAVEEFQLGRQALVYTTVRYDRWRLYKERLAALLSPVLSAALSGANVAHLRLEYRDRFVFSGEVDAANTADLLRVGSELIAPHVFALKQMWHSHTGMFIAAPGAHRRLVQILVDAQDVTTANDQTPRRSISLITGVQDFFRVEGLESSEQETPVLIDQFEALHVASKELFEKMLTDAAKTRVGLMDKEVRS
jgi:uncharacterized protein (TIGR04255 family)